MGDVARTGNRGYAALNSIRRTADAFDLLARQLPLLDCPRLRLAAAINESHASANPMRYA